MLDESPPAVGSSSAAAPADWRGLPDVGELRPQLWRLAYRFCWNGADADDAVQDALLRAAERRSQLLDPGCWASWLKSIVVRRSLELRREAARRRGREQSGCAAAGGARPESQAGEGVAAVAGAELSSALKAAIGRLPERQQTAIVLRHLEGMEYDQIAELMEINAATVRAQVRDAREALRRMLSPVI